MTHRSKSKTRSVAAIGYGCVIPAKAGIQRLRKRCTKGETRNAGGWKPFQLATFG